MNISFNLVDLHPGGIAGVVSAVIIAIVVAIHFCGDGSLIAPSMLL